MPELKEEAKLLEKEPDKIRVAVSNALHQMEHKILAVARQHFAAHPEEEDAPFVVFLATNPLTDYWDLVPKVGTKQIEAFEKFAIATVIIGAVGREGEET